ncbi:MAG TPA: hypothetical protein VJL60_03030 [Gammaproteobacteria bacterium]|nr:hypothetical protein [Gammaproteobacteria bacterium]
MLASQIQVVISAVDNVSARLKKISGSFVNFEAAASASKVAMLGLAGVVVAVGVKAIQGAAKFEQYESTLTVMLGTADKAKSRLQELSDIAAKTPFEMPQVVELGNKLQALGRYSKENVVMLGDLAAAAGKPIEQVSGAFAKLASGQKGVAVDMFRDLLISTEDWTRATGKGISKSGELMASTQEMLAALPKIMADKKFTGMMDAQSNTLIGKWSNLMDTINAKFRDLGQKLLPLLKPAIDGLITAISKIDIDKIFKFFSEHQTAVLILAGAILGIFVPALWALAVAAGASLIALAPYMLAGAAIAGIVAGIIWIVKNWDMLKSKALEIWGIITAWISEKMTAIWTVIMTVWGAIYGYIQSVVGLIVGIFKWELALIVSIVLAVFDAMGIDIFAVFGSIRAFIVETWAGISSTFSEALTALSILWGIVWGGISDFFSFVWGKISTTVVAAFDFIQKKFLIFKEPLVAAWKTLWGAISDVVIGAWDGVKSIVTESINWITSKINKVISSINSFTSVGASALGISVPSLPTIPRLASGGVVNRPTTALIGEAGPEAVIPLRKMAGLGGGINITITGNSFFDDNAAETFGDKIVAILKKEMRI